MTVLRERPNDNWWEWVESFYWINYLDILGEVGISLDYWIVMGVIIGITDAETVVMYWDKLLYTHILDWAPTLIHATFFYIWDLIGFGVYIDDDTRSTTQTVISSLYAAYQPFRVVFEVALLYYIVKWKNELRMEWRYRMQDGALDDLTYEKAHHGGVGPARHPDKK